ncbi:aminotransferase class V-fold PLP-dependent enzyme [Sphingobacterium sp. Mn56C]|uniref:aminotransferase class V-fold PLP-dependent enzyme n=1 Tax=Sphingobacterium sp. Mn56C TaxID=3395261 RepID=UPI003BCE9EE5
MDYKSYFDIPEGISYFNTPGNGLLPKSHHAWRRQREYDFFNPKGDLREQQGPFIDTVKAAFGGMFNCPTANIFAVPNFSFGFNTLMEGLDSSLSCALLHEDYPSLNYPVLYRGFPVEWITVDAAIETNIRAVVATKKPKILLLSIVQYVSGVKIDLDFIKQLRNDFPDLLIIGDATQYLGTEPFDFLASGFDAVGGSGYKWLMAGFGNGYFMVSDRLKAMLYAKAQQMDRPTEAMWSNKTILNTFFEPGHQDTLSHGTLLQSINFFNAIGLENVQAYLNELRDYAYQAFKKHNLLLPIAEQRALKSSVVNLQIPPEWYPQLLELGIRCFPRGGGIRIGLHIYNDKTDIDYLIKSIERIKNEL